MNYPLGHKGGYNGRKPAPLKLVGSGLKSAEVVSLRSVLLLFSRPFTSQRIDPRFQKHSPEQYTGSQSSLPESRNTRQAYQDFGNEIDSSEIRNPNIFIQFLRSLPRGNVLLNMSKSALTNTSG
jgi:hypothetical protein